MPSDHERFQLPEMIEALLDEQQVLELLRDLRTTADVQSVTARAGSRRGATPAAPLTLDEVPERLRSATGSAVRIQYQFAGSLWLDTLTATSGSGCRLVRIRHDRS